MRNLSNIQLCKTYILKNELHKYRRFFYLKYTSSLNIILKCSLLSVHKYLTNIFLVCAKSLRIFKTIVIDVIYFCLLKLYSNNE